MNACALACGPASPSPSPQQRSISEALNQQLDEAERLRKTREKLREEYDSGFDAPPPSGYTRGEE